MEVQKIRGALSHSHLLLLLQQVVTLNHSLMMSFKLTQKNQKEVSPTQMFLTFITGLSVYKHVLFVLTLFLKRCELKASILLSYLFLYSYSSKIKYLRDFQKIK